MHIPKYNTCMNIHVCILQLPCTMYIKKGIKLNYVRSRKRSSHTCSIYNTCIHVHTCISNLDSSNVKGRLSTYVSLQSLRCHAYRGTDSIWWFLIIVFFITSTYMVCACEQERFLAMDIVTGQGYISNILGSNKGRVYRVCT